MNSNISIGSLAASASVENNDHSVSAPTGSGAEAFSRPVAPDAATEWLKKERLSDSMVEALGTFMKTKTPKKKNILSRLCTRIAPWVAAGLEGFGLGAVTGQLTGGAIGLGVGACVGVFPGGVLTAPVGAVLGGLAGYVGGTVAGGLIGCIIGLNNHRKERQERVRLIWAGCAPPAHLAKEAEKTPEQAPDKTAFPSVAEKKIKAWAARRDTGVSRMQESAQDSYTASLPAL